MPVEQTSSTSILANLMEISASSFINFNHFSNFLLVFMNSANAFFPVLSHQLRYTARLMIEIVVSMVHAWVAFLVISKLLLSVRHGSPIQNTECQRSRSPSVRVLLSSGILVTRLSLIRMAFLQLSLIKWALMQMFIML